MRTARSLLVGSALLLVAFEVQAATRYLSPDGDDAGSGDRQSPWRSWDRLWRRAAPGDLLVLLPGEYAGPLRVRAEGAPGRPITLRAEPGAVVAGSDEKRDALTVRRGAHLLFEGLEVRGAARAGVRVSESRHVTFRRVHFHHHGKWGLFTDFSDDAVAEDSEFDHRERQHGVYFSNSGDRPILRRSRVHDNRQNGVHVNGDPAMGSDGVISGAIIEGNHFWGNWDSE